MSSCLREQLAQQRQATMTTGCNTGHKIHIVLSSVSGQPAKLLAQHKQQPMQYVAATRGPTNMSTAVAGNAGCRCSGNNHHWGVTLAMSTELSAHRHAANKQQLQQAQKKGGRHSMQHKHPRGCHVAHAYQICQHKIMQPTPSSCNRPKPSAVSKTKRDV